MGGQREDTRINNRFKTAAKVVKVQVEGKVKVSVRAGSVFEVKSEWICNTA